jgi:exopolyphosphatase/guanosine-5'-triphosphate,3'-diphosphate pyrophosphatase
MLYVAIDLGTYLFRCIAIKKNKLNEPGEIVLDQVCVVNFGKVRPGMKLSSSVKTRIEKAFEKFSFYIKSADKRKCFATEALRCVSDSDAFVKNIQQRFGIRIEIISPKKEIYLSALGCQDYFDKEALVLDVGSGSTEIARVVKNKNGQIVVKDWVSLKLGLVNCLHFASKQKKELERLHVFAKKNRNLSLICAKCSVLKTSYMLFHKTHNVADGVYFQQQDLEVVNETIKSSDPNELKTNPYIGNKVISLVKKGLPWVVDVIKAIDPSNIMISERGMKEGLIESMIYEAQKSS